METRDSEDLGKPQKKLVSGSWQIDEPATVRPEVLSEERTPHVVQETQDNAPHYYIPIQRNSIFNRTVRHRSKSNAGGAPERNTTPPAGQYQGQLSQLLLDFRLESMGLKGPN